MAAITIRNLDDSLKQRLRVRAALKGKSMEEEAREILRTALDEPPAADETNLLRAVWSRVAPLGGIDLPEIPRAIEPDRVRFNDDEQQ